ncbi:MAG: TetR/AcrR family transcriptional regulator [Mycobacteriales bacterium]
MPEDSDQFVSSVWLRPPRARRGQPTLSRDQIVAAAVELLDAGGLDGLSMRRLGTRLDAGATSLYWHVANKDDLLELAADHVMGEIEIPDPAEAGWRSAAGSFVRGYRSMILRHPWITRLFGVRPMMGPHAMRMGDRMVAMLAAAGFTGTDLAYASSVLMSHAIGSATLDTAVRTATSRTGKSVEELTKELEPYIADAAADYPNYAEWWEKNRDMDLNRYYDDGFEFGLERILDGLEAWLTR